MVLFGSALLLLLALRALGLHGLHGLHAHMSAPPTHPCVHAAAGRHELLVSLDDDRLGVAKTGAAMANQWFKQELFQDPDLLDDDDEEDEEEEAAPPRGAKAGKAAAAAKGKGKAAKKARAAADSDEEGGAAEAAGAGPSDSDEGSDEDEMVRTCRHAACSFNQHKAALPVCECLLPTWNIVPLCTLLTQCMHARADGTQ